MLKSVFVYADFERKKILYPAFLLLLYLAGVAHWSFIFNFGKMKFNAGDWPKEYAYYSILKKAVGEKTIPYHYSCEIHKTRRFLSIFETVLSPQIYFLKHLDIGRFVLFNVLLCYTLCFIGCLFLKEKLKLSFFSFIFIYFIFNFNGHIVSHLFAGHSMWNGYFFLPFFFMFFLDFLDNPQETGVIIKISLLLFLICLQGSMHVMNWCILLLILLAVSGRGFIRGVLHIIALTTALTGFRLFPAARTFWKIKYPFVTGYPSLWTMFEAFVKINDFRHLKLGSIFGRVHWWEFDIYISLLGLVFIGYFGVYLFYIKKKNADFSDLRLPIAIMTGLSLGVFYALVYYLPVPYLNMERVPSRFIVMPVLLLALIACRNFDEFHKTGGFGDKSRIVLLLALMHTGFSMFSHSVVWRIELFEKEAGGGDIFFLLGGTIFKDLSDKIYNNTVFLSVIISVCGLLFSLYFILRKKRFIKPL